MDQHLTRVSVERNWGEHVNHILIQLSFRGSSYSGFQVQANAITVQQVLQDALEKVLGVKPPIVGCSRTDAGVHARRFYCTIPVLTQFPIERLPDALNFHLPKDTAVAGACMVDLGFHARYTVIAREYRYNIWLAPYRNVFDADTSLHCHKKVDVEAFKAQALYFKGTHDFAAFQATGSSTRSTVRTVYDCSASKAGDMLTLSIVANGYLYNMARIMVGTLIEAASGAQRDVRSILLSADRKEAGYTAPAHGLTLHQVYYPPGSTAFPETEFHL